MPARLYRTILPVSDIDLAAKFYGVVLGEAGQRVSRGRHYFSGDADGAILACSVDNLEAARERCEASGARDVTQIRAMPWGETRFYALDPFDNPISFVKSGTEFTGS